jgi:hypothetical protein
MELWLMQPREIYEVEVYRFADRLPPAEVFDAVTIAQTKIPEGGLRGFRYFCGVCNRKLYHQKIRRAWNLPDP